MTIFLNRSTIAETCATTSQRSRWIYLFENHINFKRHEWIVFERYWWARECTLYLRSKKCRHAVWPSSSSSPFPPADRLSHFSFAAGPPFRYRSLVLHLPKRSLCPLVFILLHLQNPLRIFYPLLRLPSHPIRSSRMMPAVSSMKRR